MSKSGGQQPGHITGIEPWLIGRKIIKCVLFKPIIRSCTYKNTEVNYKYYDDVQMLLNKFNGARVIFVF